MDTKFQKKHESDMTSKEKRQLEREKLASMHGGEKAEYILSYYKFHIAVVVILIFAVFGITQWVDSWKDEDYIYALVVNAPTEGEGFMEDFRASLEDEEEHHKYVLDTGVFFTTNLDGEKELAYTEKVKMTTLVGAGTADVFICPESIYKLYGGSKEKVLYDISELMGEEFVTEYSDLCMKDAVRVENSRVLKKYGLSTEEPAYLMVFQYTDHPETAKEFVQFIVE